MNDFIIREAQKTDLIAMNDIRNYYITNTTHNLSYEPKTLQETTEWYEGIKDVFPLIVAVQDSKIIGWASLGHFRMYQGYSLTAETTVYIHHEYKRQGIGYRLMEELEKRAKQDRFHCLIAVITHTNEPSIAFHQNCGFHIEGELHEVAYKSNTFLDIIMMTKLI